MSETSLVFDGWNMLESHLYIFIPPIKIYQNGDEWGMVQLTLLCQHDRGIIPCMDARIR